MDSLKVVGLGKKYGSLSALDGVELSLGQGEFFALLGPNGAGKSTLINIVAGLTRASSGRAAVFGHDVVKDWRRARYRLGVVPQELAYDPFFTVREMLRLQAGYFGLGRENRPWREELLAALGLEDKADALMSQLSGGMKRRVLIAQALVHKPSLVVLDEPTAGVDVALRARLWDFIRGLNRRGHTIILTTHYLEEAEKMCARIAVINRGRLLANAVKEDLLSKYSRRLLRLQLTADSASALPSALLPKQEKGDAGEIRLRLHRRDDRVGDVLAALDGAGIRFSDLRLQEAGLTEVYTELINADTGKPNV